MPRRTRSDDLDQALEDVLSDPDTALSRANQELSALLRIAARLRELPRQEFRARLGRELGPPIAPRDLREAARTLPERELRALGSFDRATVGLFRFSGRAPWERHPDGDELMVVLEGGGEITVLAESGPVHAELRPGTLFVCPRGLWHRPVATPSMTALYLTPLAGSESSIADDPRAS
jgi:mannose-6-phosphate isomerase-like protein (cupin superfamily)